MWYGLGLRLESCELVYHRLTSEPGIAGDLARCRLSVYAEAMITHSQPGTRLIAFILLLLLAGSSVLSGSMMPLHLANLGLLLLVATS